MKNLTQLSKQLLFVPFRRSLTILMMTALFMAAASSALAATQVNSSAPRITAEISSAQMTQLPGSKHPLALAQYDSGRLPSGTRLEGISLYFNLTPGQKADLQALMTAQQTPGSPLYHQWLTPEQFGERFGMADSDIAKVKGWLEQQGFSIDSVANAKTMIRFSGTVAQVEAAFATEMHTYTANGVKHFAPSTALSVPSSMAGVVGEMRNLDDFRPKSHLVARKNGIARPRFTGSDGYLLFAPGDIAVEYDINKAYNAGYTGIGQTITIVGQSAVSNTDIENFELASGLPAKDPSMTLVPSSGASMVVADGDETESDIDIEWSGAIAKGATVNFVYVGNNQNYSVFDALQYAIDNKIGNVISSSYGACEAELPRGSLEDGQSVETGLETAFKQAATQGQSVMSAAGDDGAVDCYGESVAQPQALAVDYPASSAYVTAVGGTEISQASSSYLTPGDGYWLAEGSNDIVNSVVQYIPEQAWNEAEANCGQSDCLAAGGGGASSLFTKPSWQEALTPADGHRDVPDISLNAAIIDPGYLFCSSDPTDWESGQESSCSQGFRDSFSGDPTYAGGTSFAAPIFAGMVAIINQQQGYTTGQGLVNPTLYTLAGTGSSGSAYSNPDSAFHDIVSGNNGCPAGNGECSSTVAGFAAKAGYDQATGLGTIDFYNLANAWPASTGPTLIATTTTVTPSSTSPTINTSDTFTIGVTSDTGSTVPSGTINITVDSGTAVSETLAANGTYSYQYTFTTAGSHTVFVAYAGDSTFAASSGQATATVAGTTTPGTFALTSAPGTLTVTQGSTGTETVTVTPANGYTGTVTLSVGQLPSALDNLCGGFSSSNADGSVTISGATAGAAQLILDTNASDCATADAVQRTGKRRLSALAGARTSSNTSGSGGVKTVPATVAFAGLLLAGFVGRYSRKLRSLAGVIVLIAVGLTVSACGSGNGGTTVSDPPKGTYTIDVTGQDVSQGITGTPTSFTFTIN